MESSYVPQAGDLVTLFGVIGILVPELNSNNNEMFSFIVIETNGLTRPSGINGLDRSDLIAAGPPKLIERPTTKEMTIAYFAIRAARCPKRFLSPKDMEMIAEIML
jgi:hypothetical protein